MPLHAYWDDLLGTSEDYTAIDFLATEIWAHESDLIGKPPFTAHTTYLSWAEESNGYAIAVAYLDGRLRFTPTADFRSGKVAADQVPALPPAYAANARDLAKLRFALAAQRLLGVLLAALKGG